MFVTQLMTLKPPPAPSLQRSSHCVPKKKKGSALEHTCLNSSALTFLLVLTHLLMFQTPTEEGGLLNLLNGTLIFHEEGRLQHSEDRFKRARLKRFSSAFCTGKTDEG